VLQKHVLGTDPGVSILQLSVLQPRVWSSSIDATIDKYDNAWPVRAEVQPMLGNFVSEKNKCDMIYCKIKFVVRYYLWPLTEGL
jgi:hypothetical protein